jgi:hypothetical protein
MKHGCYNHEPFKDEYYALNREYTPDGRFNVRNVLIKRVSSDACQYDLNQTDPACEGCKHKEKQNEA